jgi:hypothetical protein
MPLLPPANEHVLIRKYQASIDTKIGCINEFNIPVTKATCPLRSTFLNRSNEYPHGWGVREGRSPIRGGHR